MKMPCIRKNPKVIPSLLLFLALVVAALPAEAVDPIKAALDAGGQRLDDLQNGDGGWFFTVGDADCGAGAGVSCRNTFGVTALGLVQAFRVTRDNDVRAAAVDSGEALVDFFEAGPGCDSDPATGDDRPFSTDVTFLMELQKTTHVARYKQVARSWFECIKLDFDAADRADNRIDNRIGQGLNNLGAWDAANDIRAGVASDKSDNKNYALAEAKQVIARQTDWDVDDPDCPGCELLSKDWLLGAMVSLKDPVIKPKLTEYRDTLVLAQESNGSWKGDTQITAYVVLGLSAIPPTPGVRRALNRATSFLLSQQLGNGGFAVGVSDPSENTEVNGEVLQALKAAK